MRQNFLRNCQMTAAVFVDLSRSHLEELVQAESRGRGDAGNALRRIATREGISFSTLWVLIYKRPKSVDASVFYKLTIAREAMRDQRYQSSRKNTEAVGWVSQTFLRVADALVRVEDGGEAERLKARAAERQDSQGEIA
jgi:hypothetical protein